MSYNRYYQAPDYTEKLAQIYARQTRQNEEDLRNKLEQSQQIADADPGVAALNMTKAALGTAAKLAPFAKGLADKVEKGKQAKYKREWDKYSPEKKEAILKAWSLKERGLEVGDQQGLIELQKDTYKRWGIELPKDLKKGQLFGTEKLTEGQREYWTNLQSQYKGLSGTNYLRHQKHTARAQLSIMTDQYVRAEMLKEMTDKREAYALAPDGIIKASEVNDWRRKKMNSLGYSDGILAEIERETKRKSSTTSILDKAKTKTAASVVKNNKFADEFTAATQIEGQNLGQFSHDWIQDNVGYFYEKDGQTAQQQATAAFANNMYNLGATGALTREAWATLQGDGILSSYPDPNDPNKIITKPPASGDTFEKVYLDKNGNINRHVLRGIKKGENLSIAEQQAIGETYYTSVLNGLRTGKIEHGTAAYTTAIARLNGMQLKNFDAKMKALDRIATNDQSKDAYASEMLKYEKAINEGTLYETNTLAEIKLIGNVQAREELEALAKKQQHAATQISMKDRLGEIKKEVKGERKNLASIFGVTELTGPTGDVYRDISGFYKRSFFKKVAAGRTDYDIMALEARQETDTYKINNGWGIKLGDDKSGKFSVARTNGEYENYRKTFDIESNPIYKRQEAKWTSTNGIGWEKTYQSNLTKFSNKIDPETKLPVRYGKVGGIFSNAQLAYFANTGQISAEMRYIAAREGVNISRLLGYAINSVVDSKDPDVQRFSENFNLERIETAKGSDEIILEKGYSAEKILTGYTKTDLQTLNSRAKRFGFDSLSGKEVERLLVYLGETSTLSEGATNQVRDLALKEREELRRQVLNVPEGKTIIESGIEDIELGRNRN